MIKAADKIQEDVSRVPTGLDRLEAQIKTVLELQVGGVQNQLDAIKAAAAKQETSLEAKIDALSRVMDVSNRAMSNREGMDAGRGNLGSWLIAGAMLLFAAVTLWANLGRAPVAH